ncbi:M28 family peptidase [Nitratireductor aquimarinus]|uniref:M28 family peptidase n=1 Tax=Nitratireductor aquimarinus TaxID=889300 RepID=UPI001A8C712E|nr:M28 family peptidase [Nitratireductor aquimarinus]MBN8245763.1 M28 family peptidase [Nitratireductor aquimarinus]MBY6134143.1 M28 family peptidase [Nitratireductor aquimarinus]MCA1305243.1 M28 family peptidase [Nitratireductor aquimarinus]
MLSPSETTSLAQIQTDLGWSLVNEFSQTFRCLPDEATCGAEILTDHLRQAGLIPTIHRAPLYLGIPLSASVSIGTESIDAKASALSPQATQTALAVHLPARKGIGRTHTGDAAMLFDFGDKDPKDILSGLEGKIVVTDGLSNPARTQLLASLGAIGVIVINPGDRSHWGTNSLIWGNPDDRTIHNLPKIASVAVPNTAQTVILDAIRNECPITLECNMFHGWAEQSIVTIDVHPTTGPTQHHVLFHSHYDSWEVGVGDNATGNAVLLETARALAQCSDKLSRTIRFAWWPGHSAGRYAGSTWYADRFGLELFDNCVAHVNCDSPGCKEATSYAEIRAMIETEDLVKAATHDLFGATTEVTSPGRAGDYSFSNLGISGCMLTSSMVPAEERRARGWYAVGGCGGNAAWHSEYDTIDIADRKVLENDIRLYTLLALRLSDTGHLPLDYRKSLAQLDQPIAAICANAHRLLGTDFGLAQAFADARNLLDAFYASDAEASDWNRTVLARGREIVRLGYAEGPVFDQDPARAMGVLPLAEGLISPLDATDHASATRLGRVVRELVYRLRHC